MLGELPPSTKPMERYGRVALAILVALEIPEYHSGKWTKMAQSASLVNALWATV